MRLVEDLFLSVEERQRKLTKSAKKGRKNVYRGFFPGAVSPDRRGGWRGYRHCHVGGTAPLVPHRVRLQAKHERVQAPHCGAEAGRRPAIGTGHRLRRMGCGREEGPELSKRTVQEMARAGEAAPRECEAGPGSREGAFLAGPRARREEGVQCM